ncbi:hypothetical protein [Pseudoxanthomonas sp.]|uniref:hypothetical protein n=1 Tax=Pseudoxanthomonas sp. TaxID=1871049 RepID=UPI003F7DDA29
MKVPVAMIRSEAHQEMPTNDAQRETPMPPLVNSAREAALKALGDLRPVRPPLFENDSRTLWLSSRTEAGRDLPSYFLVYFLLVDFLEFPHMGKSEKSAWTVPVRYRGRLYGVEHRKMGLGVFAPSLDPDARMSGKPTEDQEADAKDITALITKAVDAAGPYFDWRVKKAASGTQLNVLNKGSSLFERYEYFRDRFKALSTEEDGRKFEHQIKRDVLDDGMTLTNVSFPSLALLREADWNAQAAVEAFFSWTEHVFIHLAILQGRARTGDDVAKLAGADWKAKFKAALDVNEKATKNHYEVLLDLRAQIRNFMAHGSFGKRGEAFLFHSGAGAVPLLLTDDQRHRYSLTGKRAFNERWAITEIESFIAHLWSGARAPAKHHILSDLPSILTFAEDGTYKNAMVSEEAMEEFIENLAREFDNAANMDW